MKGMRDDLERIFVLQLIKSLDVIKESFFVSDIIITLEMVMHPQLI
jgi:hypothetical protein